MTLCHLCISAGLVGTLGHRVVLPTDLSCTACPSTGKRSVGAARHRLVLRWVAQLQGGSLGGSVPGAVMLSDAKPSAIMWQCWIVPCAL